MAPSSIEDETDPPRWVCPLDPSIAVPIGEYAAPPSAG
jgi:hypothetical protein